MQNLETLCASCRVEVGVEVGVEVAQHKKQIFEIQTKILTGKHVDPGICHTRCDHRSDKSISSGTKQNFQSVH